MSDELKQHLEKVHDELAQRPQLDPETEESLRQLLRAISTALEKSNFAQAGAANETSDDFAGQMETLIARFESRHPQLSATLSKIATALADLGI